MRGYIDRDGLERKGKKQLPQAQPYDSTDLLILFRSVSEAMDRSMKGIDHQLEKADGELDWYRHVKPVVENFAAAFKELGDRKSIDIVLGWKKEIRARLMAIAQWRYLERQRLGIKRGDEPESEEVRDESQGGS